jgi:branched-chain amino acid transport system substrate-binding protein
MGVIMKINKSSFKRRSVLKGMGLGLATTALTGFPNILKAANKPIKVGVTTILSGRVAILGQTVLAGMKVAVDEINNAGGIDGRKIQVVSRDSRAKPDEAARLTRELVNNEGCEVLLNGEASSATFAVNEVARDIKKFCIHCISETSSLTADPKNRIPWVFRAARQGIHDAVGGGIFAADIAKKNNLKKFATCSPDYAYGRATTAEFMEYLQLFSPGVEVTTQTWPKIFQPDYTENITALLNAKPDALYSCLWGGDLVAFIDQASLYGLFDQFKSFAVNLGDLPILKAIKKLPNGVYGGARYHKDIPDTKENEEWYKKYMAGSKVLPTNWSWEGDTGMRFLIDALKKTGGDTDPIRLAKATAGNTIKSPFGVDGTLTIRGEDQTVVNYLIAYGKTISKDPYLTNIKTSSWNDIYVHEKDWKKRNKFI